MSQQPLGERRTRRRIGGSTSGILLGLALGIAAGLFAGEPAGGLGVIGRVYVGLLQMTVVPFITVSLIANIGRFSRAEGLGLARVSFLLLLALWAIGLLALLFLPLSYPPLPGGSFFSVSLIESPPPPDFFALYVPSNPIRAMAESLLPAVVLFSILLGIALHGVERREIFLDQLDVLASGLIRVNGLVMRLTPIGVFAIAASAAGTISFEEFDRLKGYLLSHTLGSLVLIFWILPMFVALLTPVPFRAVLRSSRAVLLTAFAIGSLFAVLPMLIRSIDELLEEQGFEASHARPAVLVPLAYPFPAVDKLLALLFIPFAAWFQGAPMEPIEYPLFLSTGLLSSFGSPAVTVPFLLDLQQLPTDLFQLFLMTGIWSARVSDALGSMHLIAFSVVAVVVIEGRSRFQWRRLPVFVGVTAALGAVAVASTRSYLERGSQDAFTLRDHLESIELTADPGPMRILSEPSPSPFPLETGQSRLDRIRQRGILRVGFHLDRLPFSFQNIRGDLVGFDIDMAHRLARDLGVSLEMVPFENATLADQLAADHFDVAMSAVAGTLERSFGMTFTIPYLDLNVALVVPDHRKAEFRDLATILAREDLIAGVLEGSYPEQRIREFLPDARIVVLDSERRFFEGDGSVDALLTSAEAGSAWTLLYPGFTVVTPVKPPVNYPLVYAVPLGDPRLEEFLDNWIELKRRDGTIPRLHAYWILGEDDTQLEPRWSIVRDVLGWVD